MACSCTSLLPLPLPLLLHPFAAQHTPDTPGYKGRSASPGMKGYIVNAPNNNTSSLPWVRSPGGQSAIEAWVGRKLSTSGKDITPTLAYTPFTSSTPVSPMPLLPLPPSKGTPGSMRSDVSRVWQNRSGMRSGPRLRMGLDARPMERPVQHHTFLADVADVRQIEQGLLQLMEDFQAGSLRAFGKLDFLFIYLYFLHHKPLAPIGFMEAKMDCLLPVFILSSSPHIFLVSSSVIRIHQYLYTLVLLCYNVL